jgi:peptidoglycan/xylan/chitin deacetylase (PgdA/CDA1 family)
MHTRSLKYLVKTCVYLSFGNKVAAAHRISRIAEAGKSIILNLHRVANCDRSAYRALDPTIFEELLVFLQKDFHIVPLDALDEQTRRPKVVLSFDDGYRDFIETAAPILDKFRIRANQNVIPRCIESGLPPLTVIAQDFVGKAPAAVVRRVHAPDFGPLEPTEAGTRELVNFIKYKSQEEQNKIFDVLYPQFIAEETFQPTLMMTKEHVRQISRYHDIGAHSFTHASMGAETDDYFRSDLYKCREYMQTELGLPMSIYAFPNGSYRRSQLTIALENDLRHVLLVDNDFAGNSPVHPRFGFDAAILSEVRFKALGGLRKAN